MTAVTPHIWNQAVDGPGDCRTWAGALNPEGYGRAVYRGKSMGAHRAAYLSAVGPIPEGLTIDHLCRNRACINPAHLEPVTQSENTRRGDTYEAHAFADHGDLVTGRQAGEMIGVTRNTVRVWAADGLLEVAATVGPRSRPMFLYRRSDVEALAAARTAEAAS